MKRKGIISRVWLAAALLLCLSRAQAQEAVPCLIFTGNAGAEQCLDLAKFSRIAFGEDGMTVSSPNGGTEDVFLSYSEYNRFKIGDAVPTASAGIDVAESDAGSCMRFDAESKSLIVDSASEQTFKIGIFGVSGMLIATAEMSAGQALAVDALQPGTYVAVASNGESKFSLKFKLN